MTNAYTKLLTTTRARASTEIGRKLVLEAESDRSRIAFSAPFRRLQQKAQVFSLESNAAVRSRLTHSLEVAQVGRYLADQIVEILSANKHIETDQIQPFITFVEIACLMHDIGNPPFGHFGEAAIAKWFSANGDRHLRQALGLKPSKTNLPVTKAHQAALADFLEFDGNCQGLRIASLLQWKDDEYGLNLTYTSLAAYLKYLRAPLFDSSKVVKKQFQKKPGYFSTEKPLVETIWSTFEFKKDKPQRFPLTYVMEAADDIAYCISDIEDSIEKGLLKGKYVFADLVEIWNKEIENTFYQREPDSEKIGEILRKASVKSITDGSSAFTTFRTDLSRLLTSAACKEYCSNHPEILSGKCNGLIKANSPGGHILEILKTFCRTNVYRHNSVQRIELVGLSAITGLLDHFGVLICCTRVTFKSALSKDTKDKKVLLEQKLLSLFPEKHLQAYDHACKGIDADKKLSKEEKNIKEWVLRSHLITDFISGMTDDFALSTFQMLSGIKAD